MTDGTERCVMCGASALETTLGEHRYESLPTVTLIGVEITRCRECGEDFVGIPRIEELDRAIARALVNKQGRLTGPEARFLRKQLGWSGVDLARRLGVSAEHVSRWENGHKTIGGTADRLLRLLVVFEEPIRDYGTIALAEISGDAAECPLRLQAPSWTAAA